MVGIITLTSFMYYNYGGVLQNYALVNFLNKNGIEAKAITCNAMSKKDVVRLGFHNNLGISINKDGKRIKITYEKLEKQKGKNFRKFINHNMNTQKYLYYGKSSYNKINQTFDKVIVGSDQVWNPNYISNEQNFITYFLKFLPPNKRFSYAASFGVSEIDQFWGERFAEELAKFEQISVREESGKEIVSNLIGKSPEVLIDPTMLLTTDEWKSVSKKARARRDKPYILKYFLGNQTEERKNYMDSIAKENRFEVYEMQDESAEDLFTAGPDEFLDLIENAELICTDSFHATVFSILFGKPFIVMEREEGHNASMGSRITTLLTKLELEHRMPGKVTKEAIFDCDYTKSYQILEEERKKAYEFLAKLKGPTL